MDWPCMKLPKHRIAIAESAMARRADDSEIPDRRSVYCGGRRLDNHRI